MQILRQSQYVKFHWYKNIRITGHGHFNTK